MTGGFARHQHDLRQLARLIMLDPPPRYTVAVGAGSRRRSIDDTLDELRHRRHRAQIAARHALKF
jgi:hypothetical protein